MGLIDDFLNWVYDQRGEVTDAKIEETWIRNRTPARGRVIRIIVDMCVMYGFLKKENEVYTMPVALMDFLKVIREIEGW